MSRDMTAREFEAALKRNGFRRPEFDPFYAYFVTDDLPGVHLSGIFDRSGRIYRRETIAYLIRRRNQMRSTGGVR